MLHSRLQGFRQRLRRRSQSGSAAIEFAFVAPIFFLLLFGIIEGGVMFFGQSALNNAVQNASRVIRTGQAQTGSMSKTAFTQTVCNGIKDLFTCGGDLTVDVQAYPAGFSSSAPPSPFTNGEPNANNYNTGAPCDVVVVRAYYKYRIITPGLALLTTGDQSSKYTYLTSAAAFRNEPYTSAVSGC